MAANGGEPVRLQSTGHVDGAPIDFFSLRYLDRDGSIMDSEFVTGPRVRHFDAVEVAILEDLGYELWPGVREAAETATQRAAGTSIRSGEEGVGCSTSIL